MAWWPVHEFLAAVLAQANIGPLPVAGTPAWVALSGDDPRKILALAAAGEHHVLRMETAQQAMGEASKAVAGAVDWAQISRQIHRRHNYVYIPRRKETA